MAITTQQVKAFLEQDGSQWLVAEETNTITEAAWANEASRAQFLCNRASLARFHVHDEPGQGGFRTVFFGIKN